MIGAKKREILNLNPYIGECITYVDTWDWFDEGADENITERQIDKENMVGGGREVWEVPQSDEEEEIEQGSKDCK